MTTQLKTELQELINMMSLPGWQQVIVRPEVDIAGKLRSIATQVAADEAVGSEMIIPDVGDVRSGIAYGPDGTLTGDLVLPPENHVLPVNYGYEGEYTGTVVLPIEDNVRATIDYGDPTAQKTGNLVLPAVTDVRLDVTYGANGTEYSGTYVP